MMKLSKSLYCSVGFKVGEFSREDFLKHCDADAVVVFDNGCIKIYQKDAAFLPPKNLGKYLGVNFRGPAVERASEGRWDTVGDMVIDGELVYTHDYVQNYSETEAENVFEAFFEWKSKVAQKNLENEQKCDDAGLSLGLSVVAGLVNLMDTQGEGAKLEYDPNCDNIAGYYRCPECESSFFWCERTLHRTGCKRRPDWAGVIHVFGPKMITKIKEKAERFNRETAWYGISLKDLKEHFPHLV